MSSTRGKTKTTCSVTLSKDQKSITIQFDSKDSAIFHAGWLWSNNPNYIHISSKQRQVTPGSYRGSRIAHASIICDVSQVSTILRCWDGVNGDDDYLTTSKVIIPIPSPPAGYCHPITSPLERLAVLDAEEVEAEMEGIREDSATDNNNCNRNKSATYKEQLLLCLQWEDSTLPSFYDVEWLRTWSNDTDSLRQRRERTEVMVSSIHSFTNLGTTNTNTNTACPSPNSPIQGALDLGGVPIFDYSAVIASWDDRGNTTAACVTLERGVYNVLHAIFTKGAAIISNTPTPTPGCGKDADILPVAILGRALSGYNLSHGMLYGDLFHVQSSTSHPNNVAFTSLPLRPHQDLAYYESMPGLQLLHCVEFDNSIVGGESVLVDGLAAAYQFRKMAPQRYFQTLTTVPATFVKQREGANMVYQRPHIILKSPIDDEIVAVNWSPPFEGPLLCPPQYVEEYYHAYRAWERMIDVNVSNPSFSSAANHDDDDDNNNNNQINTLLPEVKTNEGLSLKLSNYANTFTWKYRLEPGQILIFNNRRMLHGRCGFTNPSSFQHQPPKRHLIGCYTNIDDTLNRYRTLHETYGIDNDEDTASRAKNVGNGSSFL
jgi:alpha-ketoglutarate-dependent taurine dioxygenase